MFEAKAREYFQGVCHLIWIFTINKGFIVIMMVFKLYTVCILAQLETYGQVQPLSCSNSSTGSYLPLAVLCIRGSYLPLAVMYSAGSYLPLAVLYLY